GGARVRAERGTAGGDGRRTRAAVARRHRRARGAGGGPGARARATRGTRRRRSRGRDGSRARDMTGDEKRAARRARRRVLISRVGGLALRVLAGTWDPLPERRAGRRAASRGAAL